MCEKVEKYLVAVPEDLKKSYEKFEAYEVMMKCKACNSQFVRHYPGDFDDISVFRCYCCEKEKWIPVYGEDYGLTEFHRFFFEKFNIDDKGLMRKRELAYLYDAAFEAYCESCECGGRFRRSTLVCNKCGSEDLEVTNSQTYWRDNLDLIKPVKIEWLRYYKHPF